MKVFLVGTSFAPSYGGPAVSVARLASALEEAGVQVGLWAPDGSALSASARGTALLGGLLEEALAEFGTPDLIHDNGIWLRHNHDVAMVAHRRGIPRVVSTRGMLEPWAMRHKMWKKKAAWALYQRRDLRMAACLHAATGVEAATIARLDLGSRIVVIPNGIDLPVASQLARVPSAAELNTALFLGRIYPVKGLPMLIEAWSRVRPRGWVLKIAGPDEAGHRAELERRVVNAGLSELISFEGPADDRQKAELFSRARLFILPTHTESFGMAIGEALASGLPVLTTTAAPWPGIDGECGWRVQPTVDGLIRGLSEATSTPLNLLEEMGARGRDLVSRDFQWTGVVERMKDAYRGVLST